MATRIIAPAADKLREAEFFYMMMERHRDQYEAKYFLSAFLAALYSATEHNRLYSRDPRFREWYRSVVKPAKENSALSRLNELRNTETHHQGTDSHYEVGVNFPDGIMVGPGMSFGVDFSGGTAVHIVEGVSLEGVKHQFIDRWVWDSPDRPDVMELCGQGLKAVRSVVTSWDEMMFND
jgi:hypothetical protein